MRTVQRIGVFLLLVLLLAAFAPIAFAQSQNKQALKWLARSQREKDPARKIEALLKAITYDSLFSEAYHQLGRIYVEQQNYGSAELYLAQASKHLTAPESMRRKAQILFELALARLQLGKRPAAETALREAKTLANTRPMQAAILLELGTILYRQQRYPEALAEFLERIKADALNDSSGRQAENELHALYRQAQRHGAAGEMEKAVTVYDSLLQRLGALEVAAQITNLRADSALRWPLSTVIKPREPARRRSYIVGAVVMMMVLLPALGIVFFAPTARANYYLWRKNYPAAARTFEKLLQRHPQKASLYTPLAELYLRLGRNDERALKVYQTVLQLNLPTRRRDEINAILAQKYLAEGRTDSDAIEVLENALKMESRKQNGSMKALK